MGQIRSFMRITPEDNVPPAVSALFKHNFFVNLMDNAIWMVGDSFSSVATILPVFLSTLTDSPLLIGLIPAIINGGWVLPQLLMANRASRAQSIFKFARKYAVLERLPYLFFPILALLIGRISSTWALLIFFLLITWRGIAAGMVALPWQMVIGEVIPLSHRSRFFGIARLFGQILGVSQSDLNLIRLFGLGVLAVVALCYKEFMIISFDPTLARTLRMPSELFRLLLLVLIAVTIVVSLQTVGIALMVALLVTPAATAQLMSKRLLPMMFLAALIGAASSIIGFYLSYHQDVATGPAIVLTATALFVFVFAEQQIGGAIGQVLPRLRAKPVRR